MKYSKLFGRSVKGEVAESKFASHKLLLKGGFIQESVAGRYYFLPLGWRVHEKIKMVIKEEMDRVGGQEMLTPVLHPLELWKETNRTSTTGFELMRVKDRREAEFALGGTAEEMFVDLVRRYQISYKDLPFTLYQFSTKFRDELRARGGLLRLREFVMKDAYSFHTDEKDFKRNYEVIAQAYTRIFKRLGLETWRVEADNGYIGGEYSHEFVVEHTEGESRFFVSEDNQYIAHEDVAKFVRQEMNVEEEMGEYRQVEAVRGNKMKDGVKTHNLPLWQQIKDVMYADEKGNLILAVIRGDLEVNETKLLKLTGAAQLRPATAEEIRGVGSEPGFISPVGLEGNVKIVGDSSLRGVRNAYGGANKRHEDAVNINVDRDYQLDQEGDIAMAREGFEAIDGHGKLVEKKGIEVGNIFQLGYHYTKLMAGSVFTNDQGETKPFYMGCYGIGLARTMASMVEVHHDDRGIVWPSNLAPYQVHLVSLTGGEEKAGEIYKELIDEGIEVLWDDRDESPGVKFADADLVGCPVRLVVSARTGEQLEWKLRSEKESELIGMKEVLSRISGMSK